MTHVIICSIYSLVIARHKKIFDKLLYLYRSSFNSAYVRDKPLIHQVRNKYELEIRQGSDEHKDTRGDVTFQSLWDRQVDAIIDVNIGDADTDKYKYEPMPSLLARWKKIKKDKHGKHCHD